jgi:hypothetical protein
MFIKVEKKLEFSIRYRYVINILIGRTIPVHSFVILLNVCNKPF